jgi:hypothetical protein
MRPRLHPSRRSGTAIARRRGFTVAEAAVSMVLVGVLIVASLRALGAARYGRALDSHRLRAHLLAHGLLAEILSKAYADPGGSLLLGPEPAELTASRAGRNDVDDFDRWSEDPLLDANGSKVSGFTDWSRSVRVVWCPWSDPSATSLVETGIKRITVTVRRRGVTIATAVGLKADLP